MKISDCWQGFYDHTGKASDIARQLSFAGLGIIWLFYKDKSVDTLVIEPDLQLPVFIFVLALSLDLLQYVISSLTWGIWCGVAEKKLKGPKDNPDIEAPRLINCPGNVLFLLKIVAVIYGYWKILDFLYARWL
jgi:hypothetical protein